jgi:succinate dehydrogenase / fumarate reductase membrane anchor subunit
VSEIQTPLAQVSRIAGVKQGGASHWWGQRLSAIVLAPLTLWFVFSALGLVGADHSAFVIWLSFPVNTLLMALIVVTLFYHSQQGMKVIVEDYIQNVAVKLTILMMLKVLAYIGVISSLLAIFFVAF